MKTFWAFVLRSLREGVSDPRHGLFRFFFQPLVYLIVFGEILGQAFPMPVSGGSYSNVVAPGILAILVMNAAIGTVGGGFTTGYYFRAMEAWLLAPLGLRGFMLAWVAGGTLNALVAGVIGMGLVWAILGILPASFLLAVVFLALGGLAFSLLSIIAFALPKSPDKAQEVLSFLLVPMMFFGCTFYPFSILTAPWNTFALFMPTTYLSEALRAAYYPAMPHLGAAMAAGGMVAGLVALFFLADLTFRRRFRDFLW